MATITLPALIAANQKRWDAAKFNAARLKTASTVAKRLCTPNAKAIYKALETKTGVPWFVIAVIHEREASQSWKANIAQGDPFNRKSIHVPKGRGPFPNFSSAAVDALTNCAPYASKWKDWSAGGSLTLLELYNGEGYEKFHHMASPYLWAGSDQYIKGKYISDGRFDANAVDTQLGCAVMLKAMMAIDAEVTFGHLPSDPPDVDNDPPEALDPASYPDPAGSSPTVDDAAADDPPDVASEFVDAPAPAAPLPGPATPASPKTYAEAPPPLAPAGDAPSPAEAGISPSITLGSVKEAVSAKIGDKTIVGTAAAAGTAVTTADDSWFTKLEQWAHNPRFWIVLAIVVAALAFLVYNWVKEHKS